MRNLKLYFLVFFLVFCNVFAQDGWYQQNSGTSEDLVKVFFTDLDNGWAVGTNGLIIHTSDGGQNWVKQNSGTTYYLDNIFFIDTTFGWVIGDSSTLLRTTNLGETWELVNTGIMKQFIGIYFLDKDTGYVTGEDGLIIKTTNGGNNWFVLDSGTVGNHLWSVYFIDKNIGVAVGELGRIIRTTNGGINWTKINGAIGNRKLRVWFFDDKNGWIAGFGCIYVTNDGGINWEQTYNSGNIIVGDVAFTSLNNGWAVTSLGYIHHSTDGGNRWLDDIFKPFLDCSFHGLYCVDTNNIWVVGGNGVIFHTKTGGITNVQDKSIINYDINISPNPATNKITIEYAPELMSNARVSIFDCLGTELHTQNTYGKRIEFDCSTLPNGIYFCVVKSGSKAYSGKFVVMK